MANYQLRFSQDLTLKEWIRRESLKLADGIPDCFWPSLYPSRGIRAILLSKALRAGFLSRLRAFEACGTQAECDETCEAAKCNHFEERFLVERGAIPVERYRVASRGPVDLAHELVNQIIARVPPVVEMAHFLLKELIAELSGYFFTNELCGRTELCGLSEPRDLKRELTRDPGSAEVPLEAAGWLNPGFHP